MTASTDPVDRTSRLLRRSVAVRGQRGSRLPGGLACMSCPSMPNEMRLPNSVNSRCAMPRGGRTARHVRASAAAAGAGAATGAARPSLPRGAVGRTPHLASMSSPSMHTVFAPAMYCTACIFLSTRCVCGRRVSLAICSRNTRKRARARSMHAHMRARTARHGPHCRVEVAGSCAAGGAGGRAAGQRTGLGLHAQARLALGPVEGTALPV